MGKSEKLTAQQRAAIESAGNTIVSASAGSGKTFVMIRKLVAAIENGVDLENVLAVTFTKKAAEQMKEKLRSAVLERMETATDTRASLKAQLSRISAANISTIHAFCAKLLRTYFYAVGIDGTFDIISSDDALAREYKARAIEGLFERYYAEDNADFKTLLSCYRKKRSDAALKFMILDGYETLRNNADYIAIAQSVEGLYTEEGFALVCEQFKNTTGSQYAALKSAVDKFAEQFVCPNREYADRLEEMKSSLETAVKTDIFAPLPNLVSRKPTDKTDEEKAAGAEYKKFKDDIADRYNKIRKDVADEQTERTRFFESGKTAAALAHVILEFDAAYTAIKRDENKLDYADLEHLTLELLKDGYAAAEIADKYTCVFVDEYQDVNPVQEEIITRVGGGNVFLVGDVKQAIYGFRGSKSLFFAEKFDKFEGGGGTALRLSNNFRSSDGVINFVNSLFSEIMTEQTCGFDYSHGSIMLRGGGYPEGEGYAQIHVFGKDEPDDAQPEVYSVKESGRGVKYSREGLAVLEIIRRAIKTPHYDLKEKKMVETRPGDICILSRKRSKTAGIVRVLTDAGYSVSGENSENILNRPEVKQMLDILSYIDNTQQDIPLSTALLSPLGGMSHDQLVAVRIAFKGSFRKSFRACCAEYAVRYDNRISRRLKAFFRRIEYLRSLSDVLSAAELIDKISEGTGLEALYSADGGEKLANIRRLAQEGEGISVQTLLAKIKGGYEITQTAPSSSDSIKVMTMHSSKGLEFPIVIIADICATFKGREASELPFDEKFFFAPKYHDRENMLSYTTILRRLVTRKREREDLKNEFNLFYVACTRAMYGLHIMAREAPEFNPLDLTDASSYAEFFNFAKFGCEVMQPSPAQTAGTHTTLISAPDEQLKKEIEARFKRAYAYEQSVDLPVKSSATAILRLNSEDSCYRVENLFGGEGETGAERGVAYHRFLELCDFSLKDRAQVQKQLEDFVADGRMSEEQLALVEVDNLTEIVNMSVFAETENARLLREQEFLCLLPADSILPVSVKDSVLVQGAIDLLAETKSGYHIIDYKYSHKSDEQLLATYSRQLALYKKAVSVIMHVSEATVRTTIININTRRVIPVK